MYAFVPTRIVSTAGLAPDAGRPWGATPREAIAWCASAGARGIVIDATRDTIRPRQLDSSARRAVASLLKRLNLRFRGIDLFIPQGDFVDAARAQRAVDAACDAIALCVDLHRAGGERTVAPPVNLVLPDARADGAPNGAGLSGAALSGAALGEAARDAVLQAAARLGARIADYSVGARTTVIEAGSPLGVGLDAFALLSAGVEPRDALASLRGPLHAVRDACAGSLARGARAGGLRFDALAFRAALATRGVVTDAGEMVADDGPPLILDLRNEERPDGALLATWSGSDVKS